MEASCHFLEHNEKLAIVWLIPSNVDKLQAVSCSKLYSVDKVKHSYFSSSLYERIIFRFMQCSQLTPGWLRFHTNCFTS